MTSLISFSSRYTFSLNLLPKASIFKFFLCGPPYWLKDISETSEWKSTTKAFSASTWFIHFDGPCNYLHSFQKHPAVNFFENKCSFPDQEHVGDYINKFTETGLFHQVPFKGHLMQILLTRRHLLLLLLVAVVAIVVFVVVVVVVAVVIVIVLVAVVVVVKSFPELVNTNLGS